jgi:starch-binding outer membrane protein, SusD/RagB family
LNIAECYAALGQTNNTLAYLGKIRARVGIPSTNNYGIGTLTDKYAAIEACLYERRVELAYEGKRYWDVQRWKLYSDDPLGSNISNSCQKLGLAPINGTQRTGNYLQYKTTATATDPLATLRASIVVDPDAATFQTQLATLATFYNTNFVRTTLLTPMDNVSGAAVKIKFNPNYYISGLNTTALTSNPWLLQTLGWSDNVGSAGTYNYQE